jgi:hypothetical protein
VVNCDSKFAEHFAGRAGNHRDCRVSLIDDIQVEFDGDKAKLKWPWRASPQLEVSAGSSTARS